MKQTSLYWSAVVLGLAAFGLAPAAEEDRSRSNIILCMTDDQGWGDTGYNGHPELKTPNLDKMAAAGVRFDRFYSAATMCSPTRASCLSGRSPVRYRCLTWGHDLPLREVTIAEAARTAGYATGHFGKWHLGGIPCPSPGAKGLPANFDAKPRHPGNQGFDEWFSAGNWFDIRHEHLYPPMPPAPLFHNGEQVPPRDGDTSDVITDVALQWIGKQAALKKPFLAAIWFTSPHGPHKALPKDAVPYAKYGHEKAQYYGEMAGVDRNIGRLREALREMKIAENTMLWFCSDNGGFYFRPLSTGGLPGYKGHLTEGGTRVPGILEWPARVPKPFVTRVPACTMDFYPTVLDLLDIEMPDQIDPIDGISLLPLIDGKMDRRPKPIPLVSTSGREVRVIDNEYTLQNGRLFRFAEGGRKDIDVTNKEPEVLKRLTGWTNQWWQSVKKDQAAYSAKQTDKPGKAKPQKQEADIAPPGWAVEVKLPDGKHARITSTAGGLTPKATVDENSGDARLVWDGLGSGPLGELTVQLTKKPRSPGAAWRLDIENRGKSAVWNVTFPRMQFPVGKDDMVVVPSVSGRLHRASRPLSFRGQYPSGSLTMQCCGLYGPRGGIYAAVHDPYGSVKRLEMNVTNGRLGIHWHWPVPNMGVPGEGWEMPGEVLIRPFEGDWFDIAQIYRSWAEKEAGWWPRGKQAGRPDTPDWFKDVAVWVQIGGPWPRNRPPIALDQVVPQVKRFAKYMDGIPCAMHWYNWHEVPFDDNYPHYFPAKKGFAEGVKQLQEAGVRVMPYLNAHVWDTDLNDFRTTARPAAIKASDGSLPTKSYGGNAFACMCPAMPFWQNTVKDLVLKLVGPEFGVDGVYLDQVSAQAAMLCFDKTHQHPLGGGCWWTTQGYWPMLDDIRKCAPGTILTSESSAEPYVNRLDGYLTWVGYRDGSSAVPLFHAVYAGQVQLFGRLYKWDSWKGVAMRAKTAQALVWGEQLGWIRTVVLDDPVAGPFLRRQARLRHVLRRYVSRGRMARPPALITDGTTVTANWVFTRDLMVTTPTVLSGAWHRDYGKAVVLILVNVDDKPHSVDLPFDAAAYDLGGKLLCREWTGNEVGNTKPHARSVGPSWNRHVDLAPLASIAIEIETVE